MLHQHPATPIPNFRAFASIPTARYHHPGKHISSNVPNSSPSSTPALPPPTLSPPLTTPPPRQPHPPLTSLHNPPSSPNAQRPTPNPRHPRGQTPQPPPNTLLISSSMLCLPLSPPPCFQESRKVHMSMMITVKRSRPPRRCSERVLACMPRRMACVAARRDCGRCILGGGLIWIWRVDGWNFEWDAVMRRRWTLGAR